MIHSPREFFPGFSAVAVVGTPTAATNRWRPRCHRRLVRLSYNAVFAAAALSASSAPCGDSLRRRDDPWTSSVPHRNLHGALRRSRRQRTVSPPLRTMPSSSDGVVVATTNFAGCCYRERRSTGVGYSAVS